MGIKRVTIECADQVFCVRDSGVEVWRCMVGGKVFGDWSQRGPAEAGMAVEQSRLESRLGRNAERVPYHFDNVDA